MMEGNKLLESGGKLDDVLDTLWPRYIPRTSFEPLSILGIGGGGGNVVARVDNKSDLTHRALTVNINEKELENCGASHSICLGGPLGADEVTPEGVRLASMYNFDEVIDWINEASSVIIVAGLGGTTSSEIVKPLVKWCELLRIVPVVFAMTPADWEGQQRNQKADETIDKLRDHAPVIEFDNQFYQRNFDDDLSVSEFFRQIDEYMISVLRQISEADIESTCSIDTEHNSVNLIDYEQRIETIKRTIHQEEGLISDANSGLDGPCPEHSNHQGV